MENDKRDIVRICIIQEMKGYKKKIKKNLTIFSKIISVLAKVVISLVFKLLRYLWYMVLMMPTGNMSNGLKDIAIYNKFHNGGHMVQQILANLISPDLA